MAFNKYPTSCASGTKEGLTRCLCLLAMLRKYLNLTYLYSDSCNTRLHDVTAWEAQGS